MSTPARIVGFLFALVAIFAAAMGVGKALGPVSGTTSTASAHGQDHGASTDPDSVPGGLMVSQDGYTLALSQSTAEAGRAARVGFTILDPDGRAVTDFDDKHDQPLHLIAVRRDFSGYQHVHPALASDGTWSTRLDLTPGQWRVFADFTAAGAPSLTLGGDLAVAGDYRPTPPAEPSRTAEVDGYTVNIDGDLVPGSESRLTLSVSADGTPVTDLEPYLGAYGHLVALRAGDLAYLHVHPEGEPGDGRTAAGPEITFDAAVPSPGRYHLYLDFQHQGVVRTATFTLDAATGTGGEQDDGHDD
jgi:hypothetical protein